jgi:hypothetical protein
MFKRYFTPPEAKALFPQIKKMVVEILATGQILKQLNYGHASETLPPEIQQLAGKMETLINNIEELGCFYKDWNFEIGLVDFPAIIDNEEVFLCWRSDEIDLSWYHTIEDGYAGRKPLPMEWLVT